LIFLQPIWLYAITGIIIPIAIHFWNIKEGKAFPVGSIALLEKSTKKYTRTLRIAEWLLLILRCLLIIFLALLLAKPVKKQDFTHHKGWILLDDQDTKSVYNNFKPVIDSLLKAGYDLHLFDEGFKAINLEDALASEDTSTNEPAYWPLIKKADSKLPASFPVYVFTANHLKKFKGERPQVNANIKWFTYSPGTTTKQIAKAWRINENNIRVMLANSAATGNMFMYEDLPLNQQENNEYKIGARKGQLTVAYNNQTPVVADTSVMHISIYAGKYKQDAAYIKASLDAIETFTRQSIQTTVYTNAAAIPSKTAWLFWLSDEVLPTTIASRNIFKYAKGKEANEPSFIYTDHTTLQPLSITRRIIADTSLNISLRLIWKDGFGNPLLTKENIDSNTVYEFYSHFNPQWNSLAWSDAFPSLLLHLIFEDKINKINTAYADERIIDAKQMQPVFVSNPKKLIPATATDLSPFFWMIIFLLFCAERIISLKTKTKAAA